MWYNKATPSGASRGSVLALRGLSVPGGFVMPKGIYDRSRLKPRPIVVVYGWWNLMESMR